MIDNALRCFRGQTPYIRHRTFRVGRPATHGRCAQRAHSTSTPTGRCVRTLCEPRAAPLSRLPAETPCGGLPPPFPTTLPPQGDPERVVGNGSGKSWWRRHAGRRERALCARSGDTTGEPRPKAAEVPRRFPRAPSLPLLPQAQGPAARGRAPGGTGRPPACEEPRQYRPKPRHSDECQHAEAKSGAGGLPWW
jgi:hypothetical protein